MLGCWLIREDASCRRTHRPNLLADQHRDLTSSGAGDERGDGRGVRGEDGGRQGAEATAVGGARDGHSPGGAGEGAGAEGGARGAGEQYGNIWFLINTRNPLPVLQADK